MAIFLGIMNFHLHLAIVLNKLVVLVWISKSVARIPRTILIYHTLRTLEFTHNNELDCQRRQRARSIVLAIYWQGHDLLWGFHVSVNSGGEGFLCLGEVLGQEIESTQFPFPPFILSHFPSFTTSLLFYLNPPSRLTCPPSPSPPPPPPPLLRTILFWYYMFFKGENTFNLKMVWRKFAKSY